MKKLCKICRIIGAADFDPSLLPKQESDDMLIAADGGYEHLKKAGIKPDIVIGDYDSLGYSPEMENHITLPTVKDDTDLIAAAKLGFSYAYVNFEFYGVLGGKRFSHSLAAVQTLSWMHDRGAHAEIIDPNCRIITLQDDMIEFDSDERGFISVFAMDNAIVTETGLKFTLDRYPLNPRFPLGVSNEFVGTAAKISVTGTVIIVFEK